MKQILLKPVITEKSMLLASRGVFTFRVNGNTNKSQLSTAVEEMFNVHVISCTTSTVRGGTRRVGKTRKIVSDKDRKTARVTLKKGEKIDLFDIKEQNA